MDSTGDIELGLDDPTTGGGSQSVRKNIAIKLCNSPKSKPKVRKTTRKKTKKAEEETLEHVEGEEDVQSTFSKMIAGTAPLHQNQHLSWSHKVNLIGEKVLDPMIHCCEKCMLPILLYGRMLPCKHVFCYDCAKLHKDKNCPRCGDKVTNMEQSALGTVFVCTAGGTKHSVTGCRRTYLSQRDLQAHIMYRHSPKPPEPQAHSHGSGSGSNTPGQAHHGVEQPREHPPPPPPPHSLQHGQIHVAPPHIAHDPATYQCPPEDPLRMQHQVAPHHTAAPAAGHPPPPQAHHLHHPPPQHVQAPPPPVTQIESYHTIPTIGSRTNLITVPIQDEGGADYHKHGQSTAGYPQYNAQHYATSTGPPAQSYSQPPYPAHPMSHPGSRPPPLSQPPPTTAGLPRPGGPTPASVSARAPQGQTSVMYGHFEEQHAHTPPYNAGNHSPRPPWPPRAPPTSSATMRPPPPRGEYKQYYQ